jgi:HEPN domain-containing protein
MNRADLQQLAELRITEAKVLLDNGFYAGAYYLAGYAVECALKACIAKLTNRQLC